MRIERAHVFLLTWLGLFLVSLYILPMGGLPLLVIEAFLNTVVLFGVSYLILSLLRRRGFPSKLCAAVLTMFLIGMAYQNLGGTNTGSSLKRIFEIEGSSISSLGVASSGLFAIPPQAGSDVPIQFSIPPSLLRSPPPSQPFRPADPTIINGRANVTFPEDYGVIADSVLTSINKDRAALNLPPVSLSRDIVAQQHANSMLHFQYYGHWDTQGYKPYMRYTLLGGRGYVSENIALSFCTTWPARSIRVFPSTCTTPTLENALNNSEWQMVHNDLDCCNNGHRDNILSPSHNKVSLGIAYNVTTHEVYLVEDFENSYLSLTQSLGTAGNLTLSGVTERPLEFSSIAVSYDAQPRSLSATELGKMPPGYDAGLPIGAIFAPCAPGYSCPSTTIDGGIAVYATTWKSTDSGFTIRFDISSFVQARGSGVYTLYLFDVHKTILTSLSIFVP